MSRSVACTFDVRSVRGLLAAAALVLGATWSTFATRVRADPTSLPRACSASALSTAVRQCAECPSTHEHCEDVLPADFEPECRDRGDSDSFAVREVWCRLRPPRPNVTSARAHAATTSSSDASSRGCGGGGDVALACTLGLAGLGLFRVARGARGART